MAKTVVIDITARFIDQTSHGAEKARKNIDKLSKSIEKTKKQSDKLSKSKADIKLSAKDKATQVITKTAKSLKSITGKVWNITTKVIDKATSPIRGLFNLAKKPLVIGASIVGLSFGAKDLIDTYGSFEAIMSEVKAISQATVGEMDILTQKAREMGKTTKFTATEAGEAFKYMAMAGWKTDDMLNGIEGVMNLAAASSEELGTVSDIVTDAMTAFGLAANGTTTVWSNGVAKEVANATHFADVLAAASSNSNTNVALLGESFKYCAPLAGQYKFSIEDTALALGLMANSGIKASNSGTAMRRMLTQLSSDMEVLQADGSKFVISTTNADGSMRSLKEILDDTRTAFNGMSDAEKEAIKGDLTNTAKGLGIALEDENGVLKTQSQLYDEVTEAAQTMTAAGKVSEAEAIAGKTAMAGLLSIVGASSDDYIKLTNAIYNADGMAAKMANEMIDNLKGDMELFKSAASDVKIEFMTKLAPALRDVVKWATNKMPDLSNTMSKVADYLSDKIEKVRNTVKEFTETSEWKDTDFFGKVGIAWEKIIAEPFSEWWNTKGKEWAAGAAEKIGNGIGSFIRFAAVSVLSIFGIDVEGAFDDGVSIAKSFANGFLEGLDLAKIGAELKQKLKSAFLEGIKEFSPLKFLKTEIKLLVPQVKLVPLISELFSNDEPNIDEKTVEATENKITKEKEKQFNIEKNISGLKDTMEKYKDLNDRLYETNHLKNRWIEINNELKKGNITQEERNEKQKELNSIFEELRDLYPDIINASDIENGKLEKKLDLCKKTTNEQLKQQRLLLENQLIEAEKNDKDIKENLRNSERKQADLENKKSHTEDVKVELIELSMNAQTIENNRQKALKQNNKAWAHSLWEKENEIYRQMDNIVADVGLENFYFDENGNHKENSYGTKNISEVINDEIYGINNELLGEYDNYNKFMEQSEEIYQAKIKNIEIEARESMGQTIEEAWENWDNLTDDTKRELVDILRNIEALNIEYGKIPDKKYTDIILRWQEENNIKPLSDYKSPVNMLIKSGMNNLSEQINGNVTLNAKGGVFDEPHLGIFGEAGREYIIPTTGVNKKNGIDLWYRAGKDLGLLREHAKGKGGVFGKSYITDSKNTESQNINNNTPVTVNLGGMTFNFSGDTNKNNIIQLIKEQMPQIADDVANTIAEALEKIFPNMKADIL